MHRRTRADSGAEKGRKVTEWYLITPGHPPTSPHVPWASYVQTFISNRAKRMLHVACCMLHVVIPGACLLGKDAVPLRQVGGTTYGSARHGILLFAAKAQMAKREMAPEGIEPPALVLLGPRSAN